MGRELENKVAGDWKKSVPFGGAQEPGPGGIKGEEREPEMESIPAWLAYHGTGFTRMDHGASSASLCFQIL